MRSEIETSHSLHLSLPSIYCEQLNKSKRMFFFTRGIRRKCAIFFIALFRWMSSFFSCFWPVNVIENGYIDWTGVSPWKYRVHKKLILLVIRNANLLFEKMKTRSWLNNADTYKNICTFRNSWFDDLTDIKINITTNYYL